ncbi:MazF family transcriptional regulator [Candidatus Magnetomorum sp. HK-1]|nr:MazF family transcriptional regulator [Candidatus Magnetomorum sp. HK-1]
MKSFQRGQIWLVNFEPSIGHEYRKVRPALIVQQDDYIKLDSLLTVIPLSTQVKKRQELDAYIVKDNVNRLFKDSLIKTMQISSFDRQRFFKYIGKLNNDIMSHIDSKIHLFFFGSS